MIVKNTCRKLTLPVIFLLAIECTSSLASGAVDLIYDPFDGNVQLDTHDMRMVSFALQNEPGEPNFNIANADLSDLPTPLLIPDITIHQIGWVAQDLSTGFVGVADLGNIFPTGMSQTEVEAFTNMSDNGPPQGRAYGLGPVPPGGGGQMTVVVVPEPATQLILALGALLGALSMSRFRRIT